MTIEDEQVLSNLERRTRCILGKIDAQEDLISHIQAERYETESKLADINQGEGTEDESKVIRTALLMRVENYHDEMLRELEAMSKHRHELGQYDAAIKKIKDRSK